MKRKISSLFVLLFLITTLCSCSGRQKLLFLNWGEYIDESLITAFEEKYNCEVVMDLGDSNEIFYSKVRGGTTVYDVVCPSDYMVEKMYENDMLLKIDFSKISSYDKDNYLAGVSSLASTMEEDDPGISDYYLPYLWGSWGIVYSTYIDGLKEKVINSYANTGSNWSSLFDRSYLPSGTKVAMYDSHQHAYNIACKYLGLDTKEELAQTNLDKIYELVKNMNFDAWGTDNIKKDIVAKNLDLGFMWTGDFLYYYCEQAASVLIDAYLAGDLSETNTSEMILALTSDEGIYTINGNTYQIGFDIYIPDDTIAFCDNLVITKNAANVDLAYKFLDFMNSSSTYVGEEEYDPAYLNCYYVCYNTPLKSVYSEITSLSDYSYSKDDYDLFNEEVASGTDAYSTSLYSLFYDSVIGIAFDKYYDKDSVKGDILTNFNRKYVNRINTTFNNARA